MAAHPMSSASDAGGYFFKVGLLIKHPYEDLTKLAASIEINPDFVWVAGAPRRTPSGREIGGVYPEHVWSSYRFLNSKDFVAAISDLVEQLMPYENVFQEIWRTGGSSKIILQLPGKENVGFELAHTSACKLAVLKIDLGLEVFPDF